MVEALGHAAGSEPADSHSPNGSVGGLNAAPPAVKDCEWAIDDVGGDSVYETSCGHNFYFDDSTYAGENSFKFCAYCGGRLVEVKTSEPLPASPVCAAEKTLEKG
jgi:hypothetical protein